MNLGYRDGLVNTEALKELNRVEIQSHFFFQHFKHISWCVAQVDVKLGRVNFKKTNNKNDAQHNIYSATNFHRSDLSRSAMGLCHPKDQSYGHRPSQFWTRRQYFCERSMKRTWKWQTTHGHGWEEDKIEKLLGKFSEQQTLNNANF